MVQWSKAAHYSKCNHSSSVVTQYYPSSIRVYSIIAKKYVHVSVVEALIFVALLQT